LGNNLFGHNKARDTNSDKTLRPVGDDLLGLGGYAVNLRSIVLELYNKGNDVKLNSGTNDNESFIICIDSPWGTGKTHFLKMFQSCLRGEWNEKNTDETELFNMTLGSKLKVIPNKEKKISVIKYDAWKHDYRDNAFEPLIEEITHNLQGFCQPEWRDRQAFKILTNVFKGLAFSFLERHIGALALDEFSQIVSPSLDPDDEALKSLDNYLKRAVKSLVNKPLVVIVDELDRCKPTFAVQTLEVIKHIFNTRGIVFIFTVDLEQLSTCVKNIYGAESDAVGYLERFFNYYTAIPIPDYTLMLRKYVETYGISEGEAALNELLEVVKMFDLTIRDIRTVLNSLEVLQNKLMFGTMGKPEHQSGDVNALILYFYLLTVKYKLPLTFKKSRRDRNAMINLIREKPIPFISLNDNYNSNEEFIRILGSNLTMEQIQFTKMYYEKERGTEKGWLDTAYNGIRFKSEKPEPQKRIIHRIGEKYTEIPEGFCLSYFLYPFDLLTSNLTNPKETLKHTPMDYIHNQIELTGIYGKLEDYKTLGEGTVEASIDPNGKYWVEGHINGNLIIYEFITKNEKKTQKEIDRLQLPADIQCVKFNKNGNIYAGCGDGTLYRFRLINETLKLYEKTHLEGECVMINEYGGCATNNNGIIRLWARNNKEYYYEEQYKPVQCKEGSRVECIEKISDEKYISGTGDGFIHIWGGTDTPEVRVEICKGKDYNKDNEEEEKSIECIAVIEDGMYVVGGYDCNLYYLQGEKKGSVLMENDGEKFVIESIATVTTENRHFAICGSVKETNGAGMPFGIECVEATKDGGECVVCYTTERHSMVIDANKIINEIIHEEAVTTDTSNPIRVKQGLLFFIDLERIELKNE